MYFLIGVKSQSWYSKLAEMKKLLILFFVVFTTIGKAQNNKILAFINVKYSTTSGIEDTKESIEGMRTLIFVENESGIDWLNILINKETHSEGPIKNVVLKKYTKQEYNYTFNWYSENNYDDVKSNNVVEFKITKSILKKTLDKVRVTITNEQNHQLVYEGDIVYIVKPIVFYYWLEKCND